MREMIHHLRSTLISVYVHFYGWERENLLIVTNYRRAVTEIQLQTPSLAYPAWPWLEEVHAHQPIWGYRALCGIAPFHFSSPAGTTLTLLTGLQPHRPSFCPLTARTLLLHSFGSCYSFPNSWRVGSFTKFKSLQIKCHLFSGSYRNHSKWLQMFSSFPTTFFILASHLFSYRS